MPERVEIYCRSRPYAEFFEKIATSNAYLPYETLALRHITIGLKVPAAHNMPFSAFYKRFYLFEKFGSVFFYVFINGYLVMTEHVIEFFG